MSFSLDLLGRYFSCVWGKREGRLFYRVRCRVELTLLDLWVAARSGWLDWLNRSTLRRAAGSKR
jgi:hypothetical protein